VAWWFFPVVLSVAIGFYGHEALRFTRTVRQESDEEWKAQWRALDPSRRKRISQAIRQGDAVRDPDDAKLALRAVDQSEMIRRATRRLGLVSWPMLLVILALALGITGTSARLVVGGVSLLSLLVLADLASRLQQRRMRESAKATRAVHGIP
jgi:hypothetical protein